MHCSIYAKRPKRKKMNRIRKMLEYSAMCVLCLVLHNSAVRGGTVFKPHDNSVGGSIIKPPPDDRDPVEPEDRIERVRKAAYDEIMQKVANRTVRYVTGGCASERSVGRRNVYRRDIRPPKVLYVCVDWKNSQIGSIVVRNHMFQCVRPVAKIKIEARKECLQRASVNCRCTLIDINNNNMLSRSLVQRYLIRN